MADIKIMYVTPDTTTMLSVDFGDRRFTVISSEPTYTRLTGRNISNVIILDDVLALAPKPRGQQGPTKNRKWWQK